MDSKPQIEVGQRWHDDDDKDDPNYGERNYTVTAPSDRRGWRDEPGAVWWEIRYDDGCDSAAPASWILRDTLLSPPPDGQDVGKVGP